MFLAAPLVTALVAFTAPQAQPAADDFAPWAPPVRVEHFVLEDEAGRVTGTSTWRRREGARGVQFEREFAFRLDDEPGPDPVLLHVECLERGGSRLVVRETGPRGRALLAEITTTNGSPSLRAFEWGACADRREVLALEATAALPLYLAELARNGRYAAGSVGLFDPSERAIVPIDAETSHATDGSGRRTTTWRRSDGTLVLELEFRGTDLLAFRLQDGGPRARRVPAETFDALRGSMPVPAAAVR